MTCAEWEQLDPTAYARFAFDMDVSLCHTGAGSVEQ